MDWDTLRYLLAVAETGSHSAAARALRVSQPTVGRRLADLEESLGTRLFERLGRRFVLTPAGGALAEAARRMEAEVHGLERRLAGQDMQRAGLVRISCTEGLGALWLTPRLVAFRQLYPGIDIELVIDNAAVNLSKREADVALRLRPPRGAGSSKSGATAWPDALVAKRLGVLGMGFYAAPGYLARRGTPVSAADLAGHDVIVFGEAVRSIPYAHWHRTQTSAARPAFRANSILAHVAAARAGLGIAIMACLYAEAEPGLQRVLPGLRPPELEIWIVYHDDLRRSARLRTVVDFLTDLVERDRALLAGEAAG